GFRLFVRYLGTQVERVLSSAELQAESHPVRVPFDYTNEWIIITAFVNDDDRGYRFIVDTGAEATCVLRSAAERLGLAPVKVGGVALGGDDESVVRMDRLRLGRATYRDVGAVVVDDDSLEPLPCLVDGGIIGVNVLTKAALQIDYASSVVTIDADTGKPMADAIKLPFTMDGKWGRASLKLAMSTGDTIPLLLDTGYSGRLSLSLAYPRRFLASLSDEPVRGFLTGPPVGTFTIAPVVPRDAWAVRLEGCSIGDLSLDGVAATVDSAIRTGERGLLGNSVLDRYDVTIDWARRLLRLVPVAGRHLPDNPDIVGLTYLPHVSRLVVHTVYEGSAAAVEGIVPGDEIVAVNGSSISEMSRDELCRLWLDESHVAPAAAESVVVTVRREGQVMTHALRSFPVFSEAVSPSL
ncbi:MAG: aspartyl protease family protein, partial [Candidatus Eisenbacteria bacterium]|nr:aspartyl protease family protein [Candidatus Eisenbacteria bacterium]